jgi:D-2-hydroxyacid dehydrogenase (NADP+)
MTTREPMMAERVSVVVHPGSLPGVPEAFEAIPGVDVVRARSDEEITAALRVDPVLVSHIWRPEYLQPGLRWIQSHSAGVAQFPQELLRERQIVLTSASGVHVVCAEHAIGLLLTLSRDIHTAIKDMSDHRWGARISAEIAGRTIVVLGLGPIGRYIIERLAGWDVRVIGVTRSPAAHIDVLADVRPLDQLKAACAEASVLMVALPDATETRALVSADVLDALGQGYLINISRGTVVDQAAMIDRLTDGRLAGAGLDVMVPEPLPADSPLWQLPNVVITPHVGGLTPRYGERLAAILAHNLRAYRGQGEWRNRVS